MSSSIEASYNKYTGSGKGTLVGNWAEERILRDFTGVGRTIVKSHIPKKHLDFDNPPATGGPSDNTTERIYGELKPQPMITQSGIVGSGYNPADDLPKVGRKTQNMEREIALKVAEEIKMREAQKEAAKEQRFFDTTNRTNFTPKSYQENTIGRRVMKTMDGKPVSMNEKDEQLIVEHGTWRRGQKMPDEEIWMRVPKGDYSQQQPVTLWTHALDRKNFQMSAGVGPNPFARTSGFTQTADQVKSVSGYYGNIDFEQEAAKTDFRKTKGTDLNMANPYVQSEFKMTNLADIKARVIEGCKIMSPANGLRALRIALRRLDHNQNGLVDPVEFKYGLRTFGIDLNEDECAQLLKNFDPSRSGRLSVNEILHILRQGHFNEARAQVVQQAYAKLDRSGREMVTIEDLENNYDVQPNPEYVMGTKSGTQIMAEFLQAWDTPARDGIISLSEFMDYYMDVSPTIMGDNVFENMVKHTWKC